MKTQIDSSIAPKLLEWFASGRGVKVWTNQEIASGHAREVFTPGDAQQPDWRYGNPIDLSPTDIEVCHVTPVESFRGRFKAMYWGPWVAKASEEKAIRLCAKHGATNHEWQWEHDPSLPGYVQITIGRIVLQALEPVLPAQKGAA